MFVPFSEFLPSWIGQSIPLETSVNLCQQLASNIQKNHECRSFSEAETMVFHIYNSSTIMAIYEL